MMRLVWSSAVAPCLAAVLYMAAGDAAAQEIIPETATPASTPPLPLWPFSSSLPTPASAPSFPASAPAPLPAEPSAVLAPDAGRQALPPRDAFSAERRSDDELLWSELTVGQRAALGPLANEWAFLDRAQKRKWLEIANRLPRLSAAKQARMRARMVEWVRLTPQERARVRLRFEQARRVAPQQRKERWDAYLALPASLRRDLAERAAMAAPSTSARSMLGAGRRSARADLVQPESPPTKSGLIVGSTPVLRPVAPALVQVHPGASTTLMSRHPVPPVHQQTKLAEIVATPGFVDRPTLLPQRGAQGAAMHPVSASEPVPHR